MTDNSYKNGINQKVNASSHKAINVLRLFEEQDNDFHYYLILLHWIMGQHLGTETE